MIQGTAEHIISCENLAIGYRNGNRRFINLFSHLDLKLYRGDFICLAGPNGSGKSTLIRTLAGLQPYPEGKVTIEGHHLSELDHVERSRLLGIVLTEKSVVDAVTVAEIVAVGRYHSTNWLGNLGWEDKNRIDIALRQVGLEHMASRSFGTLSDGEKQRALIAKALASDTPVLLLDEPTAHLDIPNRVEIMNLLKNLTRDSGHTILISTHDLDLAMQLADEMWLMHQDFGIHHGTPEEISMKGVLDRFFTERSFTFIRGTGRFEVQRPQIGKVAIEGDGAGYDILKAGLNRLGFQTDIHTGNLPVISITSKGYYLKTTEQEQTFSDLSSLFRAIRKIK